MLRIIFATFLFVHSSDMQAQFKSDKEFESWLYEQASPLLRQTLKHPDSFHYQLIYTRIDRDANNKAHFKSFYLNVDENLYFNPASMVKMPVALLALEKLNRLNRPGVDKYTAMVTDRALATQTGVTTDSSAENQLPSIAQYIRKIFLVSDNDAYNRLYEFVGQQEINERLWQMGYKNCRITRRFTRATEDENRHTNPVRFIGTDGHTIYQQPAAYSKVGFDFSRRQLIGNAHYDRDERFVAAPMDFTKHNNIPLKDLQQMLQNLLFPEEAPVMQKFQLTAADYRFLYQYMSELPHESRFPKYDTAEFFSSYTKFFMFRAGKRQPPSHIRVFNKTGWSYGFLTDVAYIVDFKNNVEFMLAGNIYTNRDGILNDDKYEYEEIGYPFFQEIGDIIYQYECRRERRNIPKLDRFVVHYD